MASAGCCGHQLNGCQNTALWCILRTGLQRPLKNLRRSVELFLLDQTCGVSTQPCGALFEYRQRFFEVRQCGDAMSLLVLEDCNHGVTGQVRGMQF